MGVGEAGGTGTDVLFASACAVDDTLEVALEDYARVLAQAEGARALRPEGDPGRVAGVRLLGPRAELTPSLRADIEDFARDLAGRGGGSGLGWA
jgi:hypothetical protein